MAHCNINCLKGEKAKIVTEGIGINNPVLCQSLGICSAFAVTGYVSTTLVMGAALLFVASLSTMAVSLLRRQAAAKYSPATSGGRSYVQTTRREP